jgi:TRAP-type C4-dicarboxylate transport system permease small subunit
MRIVLHRLNQWLSGFCGWLLLAMMLLLTADIVGRTVERPIQGMSELSVFVMMVVIYLGLARCEEHGEHVNLEFAKNLLPPGPRRATEVLAAVLALLTSALLLYAVAVNAWSAYTNNESMEGAVELFTWPVKFIMVIGLVFYVLQTFTNVRDMVRKGKAGARKDDGAGW